MVVAVWNQCWSQVGEGNGDGGHGVVELSHQHTVVGCAATSYLQSNQELCAMIGLERALSRAFMAVLRGPLSTLYRVEWGRVE